MIAWYAPHGARGNGLSHCPHDYGHVQGRDQDGRPVAIVRRTYCCWCGLDTSENRHGWAGPATPAAECVP